MKIALLNKSTLVTNDDAARIAEAVDIQLREHALELLQVARWGCEFMPGAATAPKGYAELVIFDDADSAGCLGYHNRGPKGESYGKVFVRIVLQHGGGILWSKKQNANTIACVTSHEAIEIVGDADANVWCDGPFYDPTRRKRWACVARELADPVQEHSYEVVIKDGTKVSVSNFVGDQWFDANSIDDRYDWLGVLSAPLTLAPGGYAIVRDNFGKYGQVFALKQPAEWRMAMKQHEAARTSIRMHR